MRKTNRLLKTEKVFKLLSFLKRERLAGFLSLLMVMMAQSVYAQTYTASPSSWTGMPSDDIYWEAGRRTYRATTDDKKTWIEAKAVVNNTNKTISISFRKNSGTFQNLVQGRLIKDINTSSEENLRGVSASAGSSVSQEYEITPNFTSGSHTYTVLLKSGDIFFHTDPITITASSSSAPIVHTDSPTDVLYTSAILNGTLSANGLETTYQFVYGTDYQLKSGNLTTTAKTISASSSNKSVSETITDLEPSTTYFYKIIAVNSADAVEGNILSFITKAVSRPTVHTDDPTEVKSTSAILNGTLSSNGLETTYQFVYGTDYQLKTGNLTTTTKTISASASNKTVSETITGLKPSTTYFYKIIAVNSAGAVNGNIRSFITEESTDPEGDLTAEQAAQYLQGKGVVDNANVNDDLLRRQLAKIAFRGVYSIKGRSVPTSVPSDNYPTVYDDLATKTTDNEYYYQAARALLYLEYGDGITPFDRNRLLFEPDKTIARVDVLKVLMETFNIKPNSNLDNPFPNDSKVSNMKSSGNPKYGYIAQAAELGIVLKPNNGQNTEFRPFAYCTRGEAFTMLARIMQKVDAGNITDPNPGTADYFEPLNVTLATISLGLSLPMGNFQHYTKTSFAMSGTVPLTFAHTYNSYNTTLPEVFYGARDVEGVEETYQPLGDGWSHNFHTFITVVGEGSGLRAIVHWGGGNIDVYKSGGTGFVPESYGVYDELYRDGSIYVVKTKSQMEYRFSKQGSNSGAAVLYLYSVTDRNGNKLTINYESGQNGSMRISSVSDSNNGRSLYFSYKSGTNLLTKVSDPLGRSVEFGYELNQYTGRYQLASFTDAKKQKTTYIYDDDSKLSTSKLLAKIKLPKGNYIENEYDANHRLKSTESGVNGVPKTQTSVSVQASYGSSVSTKSNVMVTRGTQTSTYNYNYNANNLVKKMTGEENLVVQAAYNNDSHPELPTSMKSNSVNINSIEYDDRGNMTSMTVRAYVNDGSEPQTTTMTYDSMNNLTSVTDPNNNTTNYTYDSKGNLTRISAPEGVSTSITVNNQGLPTTITNPMSVKTNFEYNDYGNITKAILPALGLESSAEYDAASRLISSIDALGRETSFVYDNNDNLLSETDPDKHPTKYEYDENDNLIYITNAKDGVTTMTYDNATDWLRSVEFAGSKKEYDYNKDGTLSSYTKPDGTKLNYSYDALGRVTNDGVNSYSYDDRLRLASISGNGKTLKFTYDGFNRITKTECDGQSNSYTYDNNGNCLSINNTTYGYDGLNRLITVKFNGKTISYTYRKDSQLSEVSYPNGMKTTFGYDAVGRLTSKKTTLSNGTVVASYTFELDKVGNITNQTTKEPYDDILLSNEEISYSYNSGNRITKAGDIGFTFDKNGNTTKRGSEAYSWDERDCLTKAGSTSLTYDPLGLIASYGDITFTTDPLGIGNVLSDSKSGAEYIYGNGLEARVKNGKVSYYVTDFRGSVVAIVDESGKITHKYQYDEFGKVTQKEEADYNPFQYVGKYGVMYLTDHQYYMRARHYDPTIGRFLSEDPIWSTNLYPYADNNPVMGTDPKGTSVEYLRNIGDAVIEHLPEITEKVTEDWSVITSNANNLIATNNSTTQVISNSADAGLEAALDLFEPIANGVKQAAPEIIGGGTLGGAQIIASMPHWVIVGSEVVLVGGMGTCALFLAQDSYKAVQNARQSDSFVDFIDRQNKNGGWIYKGSQKVGDALDSFWDWSLGWAVK